MTYDPTPTDAMRDRVRAVLRQHPDGLPASRLCRHAEVDSHELAVILGDLRAAGEVTRERHLHRLVTP